MVKEGRDRAECSDMGEEPTAEVRARAAAAQERVYLVSALFVVIGAAGLLRLDLGHSHASLWLAAGVALLFAVGEMLPLEIEFRHETHTFTFTSIPLVAGLFLLPAPLLVAGRIGASFVVLGLVQRQPLFKLVTNLSCHLLEVIVAATVISAFGVHEVASVSGWVVAVVAVMAANIVGALGVTAAISLFQGSFEWSLLAGLGFGLVSVLADVTVAIIVVTLLSAHQPAAWLMIVVVGFLVGITRLHAKLRSRYRNVERLYAFTSVLGESVLAGDVLSNLLRESAEILHADHTWLIERAGGRVRRVESESHHLRDLPAAPIDVALLDAVAADGSATLVQGSDLEVGESWDHSLPSEVLIASLVSEAGTDLYLCVADRSGAIRGFDDGDCALLGSLATQAGVTLRGARLLDRVREEGEANEYLANHDPLTGLANRARFREDVEASLGAGDCAAVLLIDLDRFKEVNDTLGHHNGDLLLIEVGGRLAGLLGARHHLARLGGDEFAVMLRRGGLGDDTIEDIAARIRNELERPFQIAEVEIDVGASVGIAEPGAIDDGAAGDEDAVGDEAGDGVAGLLRQADVAMYSAKDQRAGVTHYQPGLDHYSRQRLELVPRFRAALERDELELHFQPKVELSTGRVIGVEALVRWPTDNGFIPPDEFIPIAEHTGLIRPLTRWVISEALTACRAWRDAGWELCVAVNFSPRSLTEAGIIDHIEAGLAHHDLPPSSLKVEITESTVMDDPAAAISALGNLRSLGLGISIDDFGTGYSSLAYLTQLPADELKIDRSFISALGTDPAAMTIVRLVIDLGNNLGLDVVAEGVESADVAELLDRLGCRTAQGYHFARPMPSAALQAWLAERPAVDVADTGDSAGAIDAFDAAI
jgi:diguanylate cyclase (GGDEF)-like protein